MLDSYDILGTGYGIKFRSEVQNWSGGADIPVRSVLMFKYRRCKCSSHESGNVRLGYEGIIDMFWRECSRCFCGHHRYIFILGTVG